MIFHGLRPGDTVTNTYQHHIMPAAAPFSRLSKNPQSLSINIPVRVEARHCNPLLKRQRARRGGKR